MSHSGDDKCFVARQPALEAATRQFGKRYVLAIRPDEEGRTNLRPCGPIIQFSQLGRASLRVRSIMRG